MLSIFEEQGKYCYTDSQINSTWTRFVQETNGVVKATVYAIEYADENEDDFY